MKTSNLIDKPLDWAVAKAANLPLSCDVFQENLIFVGFGDGDLRKYAPSTDWAQGGPIIEREEMMLAGHAGRWQATKIVGANAWSAYGPTPLIAAMRCFVASKLGDEVEIPDELL